jgi:hypothetical protein
VANSKIGCLEHSNKLEREEPKMTRTIKSNPKKQKRADITFARNTRDGCTVRGEWRVDEED